jgi:hypothetical protein
MSKRRQLSARLPDVSVLGMLSLLVETIVSDLWTMTEENTHSRTEPPTIKRRATFVGLLVKVIISVLSNTTEETFLMDKSPTQMYT